jgi:hypothetical protein
VFQENRCDATLSQRDLDNFVSWSNGVRLNLNPSKCKALRVSRKVNPYPNSYYLRGHPISLTETKEDLTILINSSLSWKDHDCEVGMKANKMLGLVRCTSLKINDTPTRKFLYLQLVRGRLPYASQVWCPQSIELIRDLEKIQRRATKYVLWPILCYGSYTNVERFQKLDLLPISYWHEYLDLVFLFKVHD